MTKRRARAFLHPLMNFDVDKSFVVHWEVRTNELLHGDGLDCACRSKSSSGPGDVTV